MKSIGYGLCQRENHLNGEHSVVYGEPAIAFPFSGTGIQATVRANKVESWIESSFFHGPLSEAPNTMRNVTVLLWYLVKHFKIPEPFYLKN